MKSWYKDKSKINLTIDTIMLVLLMTIAGIGFIIKYVLVPGYKRNAIYGQDVELYFWGLTRHEWGTVHLLFSLTFLSLLVLHLILHWKTIKNISSGMFTCKTTRIIIACFIGFAGVFLTVSPFFIHPDIAPMPRRHLGYHSRSLIHGSNSEIPEEQSVERETTIPGRAANDHPGPHHKDRHFRNDEIEIYGYMTLEKVASRYDVSITQLANALEISADKTGYRLGRLRKQYHFTMSDVRYQIIQLTDGN